MNEFTAAALAELDRQSQLEASQWNPLYVQDEGRDGMVLIDGHVDMPALVNAILKAAG